MELRSYPGLVLGHYEGKYYKLMYSHRSKSYVTRVNKNLWDQGEPIKYGFIYKVLIRMGVFLDRL